MSKPTKEFVDTILSVMDDVAAVHNGTGLTDIETSVKINVLIADEVAQDVWDTADRKHFTDDDVRFAIGRVLRKRLGIAED